VSSIGAGRFAGRCLPEWFGILAAVEAAARLARSQGARFLTVKTFSPSRPDAGYAATRLFYEAVGFLPIEEITTLWGPENPCLLMLRPL
jgi:hypothetical protein